MQIQLESEKSLGSKTFYFALWRELVLVKTNRNRLAFGLMTMLLQQMMGVNAIYYCAYVKYRQRGCLPDRLAPDLPEPRSGRDQHEFVRHWYLRCRQGLVVFGFCLVHCRWVCASSDGALLTC